MIKKEIYGLGFDGKEHRVFDAVQEGETITLEVKTKQGLVKLTLEDMTKQMNSAS